ncbi:MAG: hypothetical protein HKM98_08840 [Gammaproteobacteria bacterium]|nr:hypothetical protein [Gammaproteobacteria bacterium]
MPSTDLTGNVIEPELGRHILAELGDLNADFIALLLDDNSPFAGKNFSDAQAAALGGLSKPAIRRLSGCAFALFDLELQNHLLWKSLGTSCTSEKVPGDSVVQTENSDRTRLFILSALMYLRHLAKINHFFAKLSFNAAPSVLRQISDLPLHQLRQIANQHPTLLTTRFSDYPDAWTDLLQLAKRNDTEPMLPAKILGYQHLAQPHS